MGNKEFIFITRFFSGLYETIENETWQPSGIPTIANLVDKASKNHKVTWFLVSKTMGESSLINHKQKKILINNIQFVVLPYKKFPFFINKFNNTIQTLFIFYRFRFFFKNHKKAIYYFDRSNIILAGLIKTLYKAFVVIRILGIYPAQKKIVKNFYYKTKNLITYCAYNINYDLCVGTQDGSGTEFYIDKLINQQTPRMVLLNGVSNNVSKKKERSTKINILFVGSLIEAKGILDFVEAAKNLKEYHDRIQINIVGKGILAKQLKLFIEKHNLTDFVFLVGSLPKKKVSEMFLQSDIYVSLNKLGNLSNTVLEAMSFSKCIFILEKEPLFHIDMYTDKYIPHDVVVRINRRNIVEDLSIKIIDLIENPSKIKLYSQKTSFFMNANMQSWDKRIDLEITSILEMYNN